MQLVSNLRAAGGAITLVGEKLEVAWPKAWPKQQRQTALEALRAQKPEIVAYLSAPAKSAEGEAECGAITCGGCYPCGQGIFIHPPKARSNY